MKATWMDGACTIAYMDAISFIYSMFLPTHQAHLEICLVYFSITLLVNLIEMVSVLDAVLSIFTNVLVSRMLSVAYIDNTTLKILYFLRIPLYLASALAFWNNESSTGHTSFLPREHRFGRRCWLSGPRRYHTISRCAQREDPTRSTVYRGPVA
ncbi:uncharacterized protein EDB91DRAFT_1128157 [Suillus paluster]|uniref:uncharacterized protein n=1 Tax=Suillus paluster TaxID=48578 RepID=UPI001B85FCE1|nr:uncharacterized protein EDB91DRAFT_1138046 [Suillus paluster]XP_041178235.1 uncharacterized protein EDB91DRAFT_1128157 [Suillus paluster]KAG1738648.1 hypothetical protein EDB91DRAFT_1138046 [Suillus paluster]KAG1742798.1 hypothetical protein EDB91DRAFT_1128157 [Suillus paluster]